MIRTEIYNEDDILEIIKEHSKKLGGTIKDAELNRTTKTIGYGPMEQDVTVCEVVVYKD